MQTFVFQQWAPCSLAKPTRPYLHYTLGIKPVCLKAVISCNTQWAPPPGCHSHPTPGPPRPRSFPISSDLERPILSLQGRAAHGLCRPAQKTAAVRGWRASSRRHPTGEVRAHGAWSAFLQRRRNLTKMKAKTSDEYYTAWLKPQVPVV